MQHKTLTRHAQTLVQRIQELDRALAECGGEAYRGCWLDSATNRTGKRYTRLRWFTSHQPKRKGCRILKGEELATATRAIALWQERDTAAAQLEATQQQIEAIEHQASALGLRVS